MRKILTSVITIFILMIISSSPSLATFSHFDDNKPTDFPRCPNPGGTVKASYDEGWHWIVGEDELRWGSDYVYDIGNNRYVQCYCEIDGNEGIQTNWLPADSVSEKKQEKLIDNGWILVENGNDFGLPPVPYLAKNINYICKTEKHEHTEGCGHNNDNKEWDIKEFSKPQIKDILKELKNNLKYNH